MLHVDIRIRQLIFVCQQHWKSKEPYKESWSTVKGQQIYMVNFFAQSLSITCSNMDKSWDFYLNYAQTESFVWCILPCYSKV